MKNDLSLAERMAGMDEKVNGIAADISEIKDAIKGFDGRYASKLVERIVYGLCGVVLFAVIGSLVALVVWRPPSTTTNSLRVDASPTPASSTAPSVVIVPRSGSTAAAAPAASGPTPTQTPNQTLLGSVLSGL